MNKKIVVIGSSNTDMVIKADHLPAPGETIIGDQFFMNPGGKGANQAVAAARLGGQVSFITKTGNDLFGRQSKQLFLEEGIQSNYIFSDPTLPSGVALITVDQNGENCIVVASGANATLNPDDIDKARLEIESASIILMQLEIPIKTVEYVAKLAKSKGIPVILNPAPVCSLRDEILDCISILTPNRKEAEMLSRIPVTEIESAKKAAEIISRKGVKTIIITLGSKGALIYENDEFIIVSAVKVNAIDTTAAGDVFNGALVVALAEGKSNKEAVQFACAAAGITVTRMGAQSSVPYRREVINY